MPDPAAVAVDRIDQVRNRPEGGDDQRDLVFDDHLKVGLHSGVGPVDDQVDPVGGGWFAVRLAVAVERFFDLGQPAVEPFGRSVVERGEGANDAAFATFDYQLWAGDEEHRGCHDRQRKGI